MPATDIRWQGNSGDGDGGPWHMPRVATVVGTDESEHWMKLEAVQASEPSGGPTRGRNGDEEVCASCRAGGAGKHVQARHGGVTALINVCCIPEEECGPAQQQYLAPAPCCCAH